MTKIEPPKRLVDNLFYVPFAISIFLAWYGGVGFFAALLLGLAAAGTWPAGYYWIVLILLISFPFILHYIKRSYKKGKIGDRVFFDIILVSILLEGFFILYFVLSSQ